MDNKEEEATRTCGHCHRDVAEPNFALHESHCRRFLCLCPDCAEPVPRDQLARHKDEQHAQVRCSECRVKMERRHLSEHQSDECLERLQSCPICELGVCFRELDEHLLVCGSRTELCSDCSCYVKLRDLQDHSFTCSTRGNRPAASDVQDTDGGTGDFCRGMSSFSAKDTEEHELKRFSGTVKDYEKEKVEEKDYYFSWKRAAEAAASSNSHSHGSQDDREDPDQISTCPHCLLALPVRTLHWHEVRCQTNVLLKGRKS
uniref:XIAP associated factor 1 n=1 Tax=Oryzias sinensis TaxID=183150 RepID=A0A8C7YQC9_9TELE